jgi:hypothetical protein
MTETPLATTLLVVAIALSRVWDTDDLRQHQRPGHHDRRKKAADMMKAAASRSAQAA